MNARLENIALALVVFGLVILGFLNLISGGYGLFSILQASLYLVPLFMLIAIAMSSVWVGLCLGGLAFMFSLPLPVLNRMEICMFIAALLCGLVVLRSLMRPPTVRVLFGLEVQFMAMTTVLVLGRFIYDRPGSANLGNFGGLGEAAAFALGLLSYFMMARLSGENWSPRSNLVLLLGMLLTGLVVQYIMLFHEGLWSGVLGLFSRQMWFLASLAFAWTLDRHQRSKKGLWFGFPGVVILLTLIMSLVAPFRSRLFFALGIILVVSWIYGRLSTVLKGLAIPALLVVSLTIATRGEHLPLVMTRSLSTLMPVPQEKFAEYVHQFETSDESGWSSPFRQYLWGLAVSEVRKHPWTGKGFAYSLDEILAAIGRPGSIKETAQALAVSGCYHNAILELAVFCGVPAAGFFVLAYGIGLLRTLRRVRYIEDRTLKILVAAVMGYLMATSGQMLMNGSSRDFFYVCVLLGFLRGVGIRSRTETSVQVEPLTPLIAGGTTSS